MSQKNTTRARRPSATASILNRVIGLTLLLILFVGLFGVGTVYLRHETALVANENKRLVASVNESKRGLAELNAFIARETTHEKLIELNERYQLGLRLPESHQIVQVYEDPTKRLYDKQGEGMMTVSNF